MPTLASVNIDSGLLKKYNLKYVYEESPGIKRLKRGRGFSFIDINGNLIKDKKERKRLNSIAVPPTYERVWYCPLPNGHLQATGFDSTEKKQYFYHSYWEQLREMNKFSALLDFGDSLPSFRRKILENLNQFSGRLDKHIVLSAMARILDRTGIRVGNNFASELHNTYGLTTLKKKHVDYDDNYIHLEYKGKGGRDLIKDFYAPKVANIIENCAEIPGQRLFEYTDSKGHIFDIDSGDLNTFLKDTIGKEFSAKDFRTWRFNCFYIKELLKSLNKQEKVTLKSVLEGVANKSGNTPSILQSSYIHPGLIQVVKEENWEAVKKHQPEKYGLRKVENHLYHYLQTKHAEEALKP